MVPWFVLLIAVLSTALCLFLWFRDVRRIMRERKSTVESAAGQLASYRKKTFDSLDDAEAAAVLERSEKIYQQAVDLYNRTMRKPWVFLPAHCMGFSHIAG